MTKIVTYCENNEVNKECDPYREWKKVCLKIKREESHRDLLKDCKYFKIIPKFARIRNKYLRGNFRKEVRDFEERILIKTIRRKESVLKRLKDERTDKYEHLSVSCNSERMNKFVVGMMRLEEREAYKYSMRHKKKLAFLTRGKYDKLPMHRQEVPYINLSKQSFNAHLDAVLKLGPKQTLMIELILRMPSLEWRPLWTTYRKMKEPKSKMKFKI